jgi:small subunit ribosomal protein S1
MPHSRGTPKVGDRVKANIFQLANREALVTIVESSNADVVATLNLGYLKDADGILRFGVGDVIDAEVVEVGANGVRLYSNAGMCI